MQTLRDPSRVKKILPFTGEWTLADAEKAGDAEEGSSSLLDEYRQCLVDLDLIMAGYDLPVEDTVQQLLKCVSSEKLFQEYLAEAVTATGAANVPLALKEKLGASSPAAC